MSAALTVEVVAIREEEQGYTYRRPIYRLAGEPVTIHEQPEAFAALARSLGLPSEIATRDDRVRTYDALWRHFVDGVRA